MRRACLTVVALCASLALAIPASASQIILYRGKTSQDAMVRLYVLKRDDGRRYVRTFEIRFMATCEDASTHEFQIRSEIQRPIREDNSFQVDKGDYPGDPYVDAYHIEGTVAFRAAQGSFVFSYPSFNAVEEVQLCTSGLLDWSAERRRSEPARRDTHSQERADDVTLLGVVAADASSSPHPPVLPTSP
jgi:hypothetical protein